MAYATTNPYTGETIKTFDTATPEEINQAISSTDAAFREWSQTPIEDRAALLSRAAEILRANKRDYAETLTLEMGKLIAEAEAEVELSSHPRLLRQVRRSAPGTALPACRRFRRSGRRPSQRPTGRALRRRAMEFPLLPGDPHLRTADLGG